MSVQGCRVFSVKNEATPLEIEVKTAFSSAQSKPVILLPCPLKGMLGIAQQRAELDYSQHPNLLVKCWLNLGQGKRLKLVSQFCTKDLRPSHLCECGKLSGRTCRPKS